jgi:hypothetical protein
MFNTNLKRLLSKEMATSGPTSHLTQFNNNACQYNIVAYHPQYQIQRVYSCQVDTISFLLWMENRNGFTDAGNTIATSAPCIVYSAA